MGDQRGPSTLEDLRLLMPGQSLRILSRSAHLKLEPQSSKPLLPSSRVSVGPGCVYLGSIDVSGGLS